MKETRLRGTALIAAFAAVLMASSCASPGDDAGLTPDPDRNHPITVAPAYQSLKLSFGTPSGGMTPQDEARFERFVQDYEARGSGAVSVSAPEGPESTKTLHYFGERLAAFGIPRSSILVGTHPIEGGDGRVKLGFITFHASTAPCGGWSDASDTSDNLPMSNFGCANQHNLAAMVRNPRDLIEPRTMGPADATRRSTVMDNYEAGKPTAATKTSDQSAAIANQ